jgi:Uma2 family endonuclease
VDLVVVGDLVEIDADGAELHAAALTDSRSNRRRDRPTSGRHVILLEVPPLHAIAAENIRPLKRVEYQKLAELGAFGNERIELIYGAIVRMSPIGGRHSDSVTELMERLVLALHGRAKIRPGLPFVASDISLPQPDLAVVPVASYRQEHPTTALLLIEVSETSLRFDRGTKRDLYAEAGVPEYWIVNLVDRVVEVYDHPTDGRYTRSRGFSPGESIALGAFPDVSLDVSEICPE